jgi:hypothetical protein
VLREAYLATLSLMHSLLMALWPPSQLAVTPRNSYLVAQETRHTSRAARVHIHDLVQEMYHWEPIQKHSAHVDDGV